MRNDNFYLVPEKLIARQSSAWESRQRESTRNGDKVFDAILFGLPSRGKVPKPSGRKVIIYCRLVCTFKTFISLQGLKVASSRWRRRNLTFFGCKNEENPKSFTAFCLLCILNYLKLSIFTSFSFRAPNSLRVSKKTKL